MLTIWKFKFEIASVVEIEMPSSFRVVHAEGCGISYAPSPKREGFLWAMVETDSKIKMISFRIFGTGHEIGCSPLLPMPNHLVTFRDGPFMWHLFEWLE